MISHMSQHDIAKALLQGFVDGMFEKPLAVLLFFFSIFSCIIMGLCTVNHKKHNREGHMHASIDDYTRLSTSTEEESI